jgi:MinD superfamily P-loop ATPase
MKELVIISGKGGTGKTSLTAAFAALARNHLLCDADVDAADLHLLLHPNVGKTSDFIGGAKARIDPENCIGCGICTDLCRFSAISEDFVVDQLECEGCGVCYAFCPEEAIAFEPRKCGQWFISSTRFAPMVHARLGIAEENSGKLVSLIRKQAQELAESQDLRLIITDGPPGIGCPVIASISGATAALIVVEPSVSGLHDMSRVAELAAHFNIAALVCINKFDLNPEMTATIESEAVQRDLILAGRIPFDPLFVKAMVQGQTVIEYAPDSEIASIVDAVWQRISSSEPLNQKEAKQFLPILK